MASPALRGFAVPPITTQLTARERALWAYFRANVCPKRMEHGFCKDHCDLWIGKCPHSRKYGVFGGAGA